MDVLNDPNYVQAFVMEDNGNVGWLAGTLRSCPISSFSFPNQKTRNLSYRHVLLKTSYCLTPPRLLSAALFPYLPLHTPSLCERAFSVPLPMFHILLPEVSGDKAAV